MKTKQLIVIALALALPASSLFAQNDGPPQGGPPPGSQNDGPPNGPPPDGQGGPGGRHRPPPSPLIAALDANHDGVIDAAEIANAAAALKTLDKNGDGQLTRDEYMPPPPRRDGSTNAPGGPPRDGGPEQGGQGGRPHRPLPPIIAALDANGDGVIDATEIANAPAALAKLDKNGDGQLTRDEFMPPRPPRNGQGGPGPGNGNGQPPPPRDGGPNGDGNGQQPPPPKQDN